MSPRTQAIGVVGVVLALVLIIELVRRRRLRTAYSLLWLSIGSLVLVLALWSDLVDNLARLLGVRSPGSMLFAAGILFALLILLEHSLALSSLWYEKKCLSQETALLEWRIRQLEDQLEGFKGSQGSDKAGPVDQQREATPYVLHPEHEAEPSAREEILELAT
jgi:hypothetical protein